MWGLECLWHIFMIKQSRYIGNSKAGWGEGITFSNRLQHCHVLTEKNHLEFYQEKEASYFQVRIFIILQYSSNMLDSLASLPIQVQLVLPLPSFVCAHWSIWYLIIVCFSCLSFYYFMPMWFQFLTGPWVA